MLVRGWQKVVTSHFSENHSLLYPPRPERVTCLKLLHCLHDTHTHPVPDFQTNRLPEQVMAA